MCRALKKIGMILIALGAGILISVIFPSGFLLFIISLAMIAAGVVLILKN